MPELKISNFAKGWITDAELDQDKLYSFLTFINSDVDYERGASVRRPGYNRHHATSLTGTPKQSYPFTNLAGETRELVIAYDPAATAHYHLFVLSGGVGYEVRNYSTSPTTTLVFDSRDNYPFITVGNRVLFADDNGWYWSDYSSLVKGAGPYTYECYQVGIDKPTFLPTLTLSSPPEYDVTDITGIVLVKTGLGSKLAQSFQTNANCVIDGVRLYSGAWGYTGDVLLRIETHNATTGFPSGTLVDANAHGRLSLSEMSQSSSTWNVFSCVGKFNLTASTTYWIISDGDVTYDANYSATNYFLWDYKSPGGYASGKAIQWDGAAWQDIANTDFNFRVGGGLTSNKTYQYKFTNYNSTYAIESEPNDEFLVVNTGSESTFYITTIAASSDKQIDKIRIYRTKQLASSAENVPYYLVGELDVALTYFWDLIHDDNLGGVLQTGGDLIAAKHLRLKDADGNLIVPYLFEIWNGRIWAVKFHDNALNYSKMLEEAGATGVAGDSIYDYFPADNKWTLDSEIRSIRKRGEDEFVVYTSNNNVHVFRGGSDALNPPPDLTRQEMVIGANCFDDRTLQEYKGRHIFLTSDKEIKAFNGTVDLEEIGDAISSFLLQNGTKFSSCIYKSQYCLGCDADNDNVMDSVIIFDLSQPRITNWRRYQYLNSYGASGELMKFYNLFVTRDARMFACPADLDTNAFYVVQLMTGYTDDWTTEYDDGVDIARIIQTQFIIPARRARWTRVELTAFYPHGMYYGTDFYGSGMYGGTETVPTYVIYAIGKSDEFCQTTIAPQSSRDISGHVAGIRLLSEECSVRIEDTGDKPDEIRSLTLYWSFN